MPQTKNVWMCGFYVTRHPSVVKVGQILDFQLSTTSISTTSTRSLTQSSQHHSLFRKGQRISSFGSLSSRSQIHFACHAPTRLILQLSHSAGLQKSASEFPDVPEVLRIGLLLTLKCIGRSTVVRRSSLFPWCVSTQRWVHFENSLFAV